MIEPATAREIITSLQRVDDRLNRLLISGWRQASAEAADLQADADALLDAGLPGLAARVSDVARATDATAALRAIALAASACQLLRLRLAIAEPPDGWQAILPPDRRARPTNDTLIPLSRILLNGADAWVCAWMARHQAVILVSPPPLPNSAPPDPAPTGFVGRVQRGMRAAFGGPHDEHAPWLRRRLRGSLRWEGRVPVGAQHDVTLCTLADAAWVTDEQEGDDDHRRFVTGLRVEGIGKGGTVGWYGVSVMVAEVERARAAEIDWLDPSMATAFATAPHARMPAIWVNAHPLTFPVALLEPGSPPKIVHLVPGLPSDALEIN